MNTAAEVLETAREWIDMAGEGETIKARLRSAARDLGIPFGVAKRIRYGEVKSLPTHVFMTMVDRYASVIDSIERREQQRAQNLQRQRELLRQWRGQNESSTP